jgi:hypothetical protein
LCRYWDNVEKCGIMRHITHDHIIRHMRFACWLFKALEIQSKYKFCLSTSTIVTQRYQYFMAVSTLPVLFCNSLGKLCSWSTLTVKFPHSMYKHTSFNKISFHRTDSIPWKINSTLRLTKIILVCGVLLCIPLRHIYQPVLTATERYV